MAKKAIGIDIGGTGIKGAIVDVKMAHWSAIESAMRPLPAATLRTSPWWLPNLFET